MLLGLPRPATLTRPGSAIPGPFSCPASGLGDVTPWRASSNTQTPRLTPPQPPSPPPHGRLRRRAPAAPPSPLWYRPPGPPATPLPPSPPLVRPALRAAAPPPRQGAPRAVPTPGRGDTSAALPVGGGGGSGSGVGGSRAGPGRAGMALDVRRLEALSLQELSALLDDEEQLQDMAREMEEVRGARVAPPPPARAEASRRAAAPPRLSSPGRCPRGPAARGLLSRRLHDHLLFGGC